MKAVRVLLFLVLASHVTSICGQSRKDIFDEKVPVFWLGIDFTGAIFIGDREKLGTESDIRNLIRAFNNLMEAEKEKYNIGAMISRRRVEYRLDITRIHNDQLGLSGIFSDELSDHIHLSKSDIEFIVKNYSYDDLKGIGLMFNIETFNKPGVEAMIWITFVDMERKEVLFTERLFAPPGGFGLRNYWAGAIYNIMKSVTRKEFEMWRKKYS